MPQNNALKLDERRGEIGRRSQLNAVFCRRSEDERDA